MDAIIASFRRDHEEIEALLRILEKECDLFKRIERAAAASSLEALGGALGNILNEQRVLRETFDDAARGFIQHERRQIEIEERRLFPAISSVLPPTDLADLHFKLKQQDERLRIRGLEERLRDQRHCIKREAGVDRAERSRLTVHQS